MSSPDPPIIIDLHNDEFALLHEHKTAVLDMVALGEFCRYSVPLLGRPKVTQDQCYELQNAFFLLELHNLDKEDLKMPEKDCPCPTIIRDDEFIVLRHVAQKIESDLEKWETHHPASKPAKELCWREPKREPVEDTSQLFTNIRRGIQSAFAIAVGYLAREANQHYRRNPTAWKAFQETTIYVDAELPPHDVPGWFGDATIRDRLRQCIGPITKMNEDYGVLNFVCIDDRFPISNTKETTITKDTSRDDTTELLYKWQGRALVQYATLEMLLGRARVRLHMLDYHARGMTKELERYGLDFTRYLKKANEYGPLDQEYFDTMEDTLSGRKVDKTHHEGLSKVLECVFKSWDVWPKIGKRRFWINDGRSGACCVEEGTD